MSYEYIRSSTPRRYVEPVASDAAEDERPSVIVIDGENVIAPWVKDEWKKRAKTEDASRPKSDAPPRGWKGAYTMRKEDRDKLFIQTGEHFENHGQYKAWCRATGKRDVDRGEPQDHVRRDMDEWFKDTGGEGEAPHSWKNAKGGRNREIPTPWREER